MSFNNIIKSEYGNICRFCLSNTNNSFINIFQHDYLVHMINNYFNIQISIDDELPKQICQQCVDTVNICEDFKQKCIQSDKELHDNLLLKNKEEPIIKTENDYDYVDSDTPLLDFEFKVESTTEEEFKTHKTVRKKKLKRIVNKQIDIKSELKNDNLIKIIKNRKRIVRKDKIVKEKRPKTHLCPICGKIFVGKSSVSAHIKTHSNERPFVCPKCNKSFRTKSHLNLHSSAHSETRDFACSDCSKTFKSKSDLKRHISIIHQKSRRATCEICGKEMATRNNLKAHMLIHSGIKNWECTVCAQKFTFKSSLKTHFRIHSGEKPYPCRFCDARFSMQRSLRDHERLHTGETPYQCPCCPKAFNQLSNMKSHFRHNHRDIDFDKVYKGPRKKRYN